jgi:hypothetical protein
MPMSVSRCGPRYFAMDLATHFLASMYPEADEAERERIQGTILCAGLHLADAGSPGCWEALEPVSFVAAMPARNDRERLAVCLDIVALYVWLGSHDFVAPEVASAVVARVREIIPDHPALQSLCDSGIETLALLDDLDEEIE